MIDKKVLNSNKHYGGFIVKHEIWTVPGAGEAEVIATYTESDDYIGTMDDAIMLMVQWKIAPEKISPERNTCTIGFSKEEQKWYGWSPLMLCGFGIGDMLFNGKAEGCNENTPFHLHGTKKIETLADAKQAAINFADWMDS